MIVLSLFDGMSCGNVALQRAGIKPKHYYASEIDQYAIKVAQRNFPKTIQLGCVKKVHQFVRAGALGHIDLLIAGSPCQGFSFAGDGRALNDERSMLFFEFLEIYWLLKKINPKIKVMLENVKMKKEHSQVITNFLGIEPILINSALVSAQNRERNYWCNWNVEQPADRGIYIKDIIDGEIDHEKLKPVNGLIKIGNSHPSGRGMNGVVYDIRGKSPTLTTNKGEGSKFGLKGAAIRGRKINPETGKRDDKNPNIKPEQYLELREDDKANSLTTAFKDSVLSDGTHYYKFTPAECERLQTLPDGYTNVPGISNTQAYKMLGNGWNVETIVHIFGSMPRD